MFRCHKLTAGSSTSCLIHLHTGAIIFVVSPFSPDIFLIHGY
jgi:hypothetical protein